MLTIKRKDFTMTNTAKNQTADNRKNTNLETISADEKKQLVSAEASIRNGLKSYQNIGKALTIIAQGRLYRATHTTMTNYAREKWDMTTARVSQYQHAYRVHELLTAHDIKPLPATESQCRPLVRIPADDNMDAAIMHVWRECIASPGKITAKLVNDKVDEHLGIDRTPAAEASENSDGQTDGQTASGTDSPSASAEMRAEMRAMKRKIAYLESALAAEKKAHQRTQVSKGLPQSAMAKSLFKAGFRAMAKQHNVDNGGTAEAMAELTELKTTLNI